MATRSAGAITVSFKALTGGLDKGIDKAEKKVGGFGGKLKGFAGNAEKIGGGMVAIGGGMVAIGSGIVGAGGIAANTFANFDDQMRKTNAIMGGSASELKAMTDQAKEFGRTTPHSASSVASGYQYMALAGWDAQKSMQAMPGLLALSSASGLDLATTSDILTDTMSVFNIEADKSTEVSDMMAKVQSKTNTSVYQLGEALKYAAPAAASMGHDLADTSTILGIFGDNGIKGSTAGTTFTSMMRDMTKVNKEGENALETLGVAVFDNEGKMRDLQSIIMDLKDKTADMSDEQRNAALSDIFGDESIRGVNILLGTTNERMLEVSDAMSAAGGTAQKMADEMEGGVGGGMRQVRSAIEGATLEIGESLAPVIMAVIPHIVAFAQKFSSFVQENPQLIQTIAIVGGVLLGLGTVITTVGGFLIGLAGTIQSGIFIFGLLKGAGIATSVVIAGVTVPVWAVIAAVVALIAIGVALWANWDWISAKATEVWNWIAKKTGEAWDWITKKTGEAWNWITQKTGEAWNALKTAIRNGWNWALDNYIRGINSVQTVIKNGWNAIIGFFRKGIDKAKSSVSNGIGTIKNTFKSGMSFISGLIDPVMGKLRRLGDMAGGLKDRVGGGISAVRGAIPGFAQGGFIGNNGARINRSNGDNRLLTITARDDEFMTTRKQRDNIFEAAANGKMAGKSKSSGDTYNINAVDSQSFIDMIKRNTSLIKRTLKTA